MITLIKRVKAGEIPEDVKKVAQDEKIDLELLLEHISQGKVVIPKNINRSALHPIGIGQGLRTKINANIGTSADYPFLERELEKLEIAIQAGADTVMDLSTGGDLATIRKKIIACSAIPVGTVPIYQTAIEAKIERGNIVDLTAEDIFSVTERHAQDGVDFMTVHCGITLEALAKLENQGRVTDIVSRGGAMLAAWMIHNERENPFYEEFDRLLEIALCYDVTLSLGDSLRPGCLADATDRAQIQELVTLGTLVDRARQAGVQVIVEGPGHLPLDQIKANVELEKEICKGAPFYVLGPLVTDVAAGYDHINAAIGGALAASYGADFLCYVTSREHLGLPTAANVREGIIASRIAAHAADIVKGIPGAKEWDIEMAKARRALDWEKQIKLAIDPEKARQARQERKPANEDVCTMCGEYCAMKVVAEYLKTDKVLSCD